MIEILLTLLGLYALLFILSVWLEDNSIADIFWGAGFVIITTMSILMLERIVISQLILCALITIWGVRLTMYIWRKKSHHSWEDARYAKWRKSWKYFKIRSFFQVYILQWVLMSLVGTPIFILNLAIKPELNIYLTLSWGIIALAWLYYEITADRQLAGFMKIKKKWEILTTGLRRYSRYPQYFGESMFWFGICLIAAQVSIFAFLWWIVITLLVRYVSGVPMLELRYKWQQNYEEYSKTTPIFVPNFIKILLKK